MSPSRRPGFPSCSCSRRRRSRPRRRPGRPRGQGRAAEHPGGHDRRPVGRRSGEDAQRPPAAGRQGHDVRERRRFVPAVLPGARDVHHRPVRPQPRGARELLPLRLVRDEEPPQHASRVAAAVGLPHRAGGQVAQRLRREGRPRGGPARLRHLARPAGRLRVRLLQLRDEPRRQAEDLGRQRLRAQAREVLQGRGHRRPDRAAGTARRAAQAVRPSPVPLLGHREGQGLLAGRDRRGDRTAGEGRAPFEEALLHLVGARGIPPRGRRHDADGPSRTGPPARATLREAAFRA